MLPDWAFFDPTRLTGLIALLMLEKWAVRRHPNGVG